jgi:thioredoxin 1
MSFFKRSTSAKTSDTSAGQTAAAEPRHLTGAEFAEVIAGSEIPVVVDFWAEWCGPCHAVAPAVAQLATDYAGRAVVAKVNADDYPEILQNFGIMGIPTLIYFKGGREVDRQVGMTGYNTLKSKLERQLS